jgi:hypothetical protein
MFTRDDFASSLTELDRLARSFTRSSTAIEFGVGTQIMFVTDAPLPWRLIETERYTHGQLCRKRMLCFERLDDIRHAIEERLAWSAADEEFRTSHMVTPGGFPGVTADWVHTKDFDLIFGPTRYALRREMCTTSSALTLILH